MKATNQCAAAQPWLRVGLLALGAAILALAPKSHAATFTYSSPNCTSFVVSGSAPSQTVTCVSSSGGGVPTCTLTATPSSPSAGTSTTITANCTNQPTSYAWTGGGCGANRATTSCTVTKSSKTTVNFTVTPSNASGMGTAAQISVTWQ